MTGYAWILVSIYTYQLKMLIETDDEPLSEGSGEKNKMFIKRILPLIQLKIILLTALTGGHPTSYNQFLK